MEQINWNKRINIAKEITKIDVDYCFLNDVGHGDFVLDRFDFDMETGVFWFDKEVEKAYRDADVFSVVQYRYYEIFLQKKMPDEEIMNFKMQKVGGTLELLCTNNPEITLSCDYIGPIKKSYRNKSNTKELAKMLLNTRNFAGSMVWPNTKKSNFTVNQAKGFLLKDRMDLTLLNLKVYYDSGYKASTCSCKQLGQAFDDNEEWYRHFISFEKFVDYYYLNDFVSKDYETIYFDNYDAYLSGIEKMLEKRKIRLK